MFIDCSLRFMHRSGSVITYIYADVILCRRLRVPKLKLILKVPQMLLPINYQFIANRMLFSKQLGRAGQYSVVLDSYQVPRATEAWPWSAIIIVCFKYFSLLLSCPNI